MDIIEYLRQFRILDYAVFDFVVSFLGIYLLSPQLTKLFKKIRINVPKLNWIFLTIPIGILIHLVFGQMTPLTVNFFSIGHWILKLLIVGLFYLGVKDIKLIKKK